MLKQMYEAGKISKEEYEQNQSQSIVLNMTKKVKNDYVETYVYYCATRALMEQEGFTFRYQFASEEDEAAYDEEYDTLYTECQNRLYTGGYQIYTSIDLTMQEQLQASVDENLEGFTEQNEEGVYALQASAVCIDNSTGYVRAIVGGRSQDFAGYTLNRAYQSYRQPGSAIKPLLVYTPSFERDYTAESIVVDEPIEDGPKNSSGTYVGAVTVRRAVEQSINTIAWKLYEELTPEAGLSYLLKMNFARLDTEDYRLSSSLGGFTNGVSALEMAAGYATLANDGVYRTPTCIVKITDASGNDIYVSEQTGQTVYKQNAARMMTDVLTGVFTNGTAKGLGIDNMPCAGKTGTTNDQKDGWFVGYTRYYTTSVWVGYDMPQTLDELMGNTYPGMIWQTFMAQAHEGLEPMNFLSSAQMSEDFRSETSEEAQPEEDVPPEEKEAVQSVNGENATDQSQQSPAGEVSDQSQQSSAGEMSDQSQQSPAGEVSDQPQGVLEEVLPEQENTP